MRTMRACVLLVLLGAPASALDPRKALTQYGVDVWQVEQGLPQNSVQAIVQARDGYLWLGTQEGLVRFDGARFTLFDKKNAPEIRHNSIQALLEARDGSLWIATFVGGLTRLKDGRFTSYTARDGLPDDQVLCLHEDREGGLWIGTRGGLARFRDGAFKVYRMSDGLLDDRVWAIHEDRDGTLWIGTDAGLNSLHEGRFGAITARDGLPPAAVHAIRQDRRGALWVGTYAGLARVEGGRVAAIYRDRDGLASDLVWALFEDRTGSLWIGTSNGVSRFSDGRFASLTPREGLGNGHVRAFAEDREGSLWIGTNGGGLVRLKDGKFVTYSSRDGLPHDIIRTILQGRRGVVWIGTNVGLARLDGGRVTTYGRKDGFSDEPVFSLYEDRRGALWIGTYGAGLWRFEGGRFTSYRTRDGLSSDVVRAILEDRQGDLWIGTEAGLNRFRAGRFTVYRKADGLPSDQVFVLHEDREGTLLLGTNGGGLVRYRNGSFSALGAADGLRSTVVFALHEDPDGTLWIGTDGGGLHRLRDGRITAFGVRDGLFDELVVQILDDGLGSLWMSSNRGISRVPKSDLDERAAGRIAEVRSVAYGADDGMLSVECHGGSQPAGSRSADGRLWFPTLKGVAVIDPAHVPRNTVPPPVVLEEVRVDRQLFDLGRRSVVPAGRRDFEFHYTALSFLAPAKVRFAYRLEGFDPGWIDAGPRRVAYYTHLPPGHHRFRVRAANNDGVWNEQGAGLAFEIEPRFQETRWFAPLVTAFGLLLTLTGYRLRVRQMRRRQRELEAVVEERTRDVREAHAGAEEARERAEEASRAKTRFLANVSHELRTPLGAILGFVEMMQRRSGREPEEREHLDIIQRSGEHLLALINDVLSISQIEAGRVPIRIGPFELRRLLHGLHEMFGVRAAEKPLELLVDHAPGLPEWVRGDEAKLRQVLINLLGNAVKFTPSGRVTLRAAWRDGSALFEVEDTGPGISEEEQARLFAPFVQGQVGQAQEGTGLGLAISRNYARLMGGDLAVRSAPGRGSVFRLTVPLPRAEPPARRVEPAALPEPPPSERPLRILVVDDTAENRLLMARLHALVGLEVKEASDGLEAVELWRSYVPDLIWMDTRMPRMDGPAATREIRRLEAEASRERVPIIAVTAGVLETEETDLLRAGYDAVVGKPFRTETIFEMLRRHLRPRGTDASSS